MSHVFMNTLDVYAHLTYTYLHVSTRRVRCINPNKNHNRRIVWIHVDMRTVEFFMVMVYLYAYAFVLFTNLDLQFVFIQ